MVQGTKTRVAVVAAFIALTGMLLELIQGDNYWHSKQMEEPEFKKNFGFVTSK